MKGRSTPWVFDFTRDAIVERAERFHWHSKRPNQSGAAGRQNRSNFGADPPNDEWLISHIRSNQVDVDNRRENGATTAQATKSNCKSESPVSWHGRERHRGRMNKKNASKKTNDAATMANSMGNATRAGRRGLRSEASRWGARLKPTTSRPTTRQANSGVANQTHWPPLRRRLPPPSPPPPPPPLPLERERGKKRQSLGNRDRSLKRWTKVLLGFIEPNYHFVVLAYGFVGFDWIWLSFT